jgi:hypothetical protein
MVADVLEWGATIFAAVENPYVSKSQNPCKSPGYV